MVIIPNKTRDERIIAFFIAVVLRMIQFLIFSIIIIDHNRNFSWKKNPPVVRGKLIAVGIGYNY
jgi:hypothetical protein